MCQNGSSLVANVVSLSQCYILLMVVGNCSWIGEDTEKIITVWNPLFLLKPANSSLPYSWASASNVLKRSKSWLLICTTGAPQNFWHFAIWWMHWQLTDFSKFRRPVCSDTVLTLVLGLNATEQSHLGVQSPQKPPFWGLNRHFKPKCKNSNSKIFRSVYQIDMKFDRQLRPATET